MWRSGGHKRYTSGARGWAVFCPRNICIVREYRPLFSKSARESFSPTSGDCSPQPPRPVGLCEWSVSHKYVTQYIIHSNKKCSNAGNNIHLTVSSVFVENKAVLVAFSPISTLDKFYSTCLTSSDGPKKSAALANRTLRTLLLCTL